MAWCNDEGRENEEEEVKAGTERSLSPVGSDCVRHECLLPHQPAHPLSPKKNWYERN